MRGGLARLSALGWGFGALVAAASAAIGALPLADNSFLTHLATGRLILDTGSVPSTDPYTFTAPGVAWTVQSWLASVTFAGAERLGGAAGLRLLFLAVFVTAGLLVWRLTRPASAIAPRIVIAALAMFVAADVWSERPYMIGVIGLAMVWLALDGAIRPWLLAPLLWIWANSHGSFPLAMVLVATVAVGGWIDHRDPSSPSDERSARSRRDLEVAGWTLLGTVAAAIGPLGLSALTFPLKAVSQSDVLAEIIEWQPPGFRSGAERAFLVLYALALASVVRSGRWRLALPVIVFGIFAFTAQRNLAMTLMVLIPVAASSAPAVGTLRTDTRSVLGAALMAVGAITTVAVSVSALSGPVTDLAPYPGRPLVWMAAQGAGGPESRVAAQDFTGNLLGLLDGAQQAVFIDDRADMFPADVFEAAGVLADGDPGWEGVLDDEDIDVIIWRRATPVGSLLAADDSWRIAFSDTRWIGACRRTSAVCR